jgi:hypothetical protein
VIGQTNPCESLKFSMGNGENMIKNEKMTFKNFLNKKLSYWKYFNAF